MAFLNEIPIQVYDIGGDRVDLPAATVTADRDPSVNDFGQIGSQWVNYMTNAAYVLTSISSGSATWTDITGGSGSFTEISVSGNITSTGGNISATVGSVAAGTTVSAGTSISAATSIVAGTTITTTNGTVAVGNTAAAATASDVDFKKSRSGAVITSGDTLGTITFKGHDGTGYITGSQIASVNSGTVATNRIASNLLFYTHPDSTSASTLRMTINSAGNFTIAAPDSGVALTITAGGATVTAGDIIATAGAITASAGNIAATLGSVSAGTTVTAGTGITATTGNITATTGDIEAAAATKGFICGSGSKVVDGTGSPNTVVTAPKGSLYLRLDGSGVADRAYINTDGATAWTAISTAA
jgi:hypothetical protein